MRFSNFFMPTGLSFFLHVSASPLKLTENTQPDVEFSFPQSLHSLPSAVIGEASPIYGYKCRENFYSDSFLKEVAILGACELQTDKIQLYPMELKPGYYIYPIFPNKNIRWAQGQPEGFDRVVFDLHGNMLYAATARSNPGTTVESAYQSCPRVEKSLLHSPRESSTFTRFGSPTKSPWGQSVAY